MASQTTAESYGPNEPGNYGETGKGIAFIGDHSGKQIVVRPDQFLVPASTDVGRLNRIVAELLGFDPGPDGLVARQRGLPGNWAVFRLLVEADVITIVRGLRKRGISAQPNHVYFVSSLPKQFSAQVNPNLFAPNLFAPNLFAPNLFAPNLFAPNLFAPNLFAGGVGSCQCGGCGCDATVFEGGTRQIPKLGARPAAPPTRPSAVTVEIPRVEIHIIDVAIPGVERSTDNETGELEDGGHIVNHAIDENLDGWADPAMAHGDFIQSIISMQSGLTATLWQAADPLGAIDDSDLIQALDEVDQTVGSSASQRKVLNLSLGGYNENDLPGPALAEQVQRMIDGGWLIVASAGNNASCRLSWPAALPGVIAVGAYGPCGPAWFSNYGPWVDACAPGVDVVAAYPDMSREPVVNVAEIEDPTTPLGTEPEMIMLKTDDFNTGCASWSGTSFAAPLVVARLATKLQKQPVGITRPMANKNAVEAVVLDPDLPRLPYFGTLVQ